MNFITPITPTPLKPTPLKTEDRSFELLLTALPLPVCVIDENGRYIFQNRAFAYLRQKSSHFIIGGFCKLSGRAAQNDLHNQIKSLGAGSAQETLYLSCPRSGDTLWVTLTKGLHKGEVMMTVLMPDLLSLDANVLENRLRELFGLTEMEAKCAALLTHGSSAKDIADIRGVSVPTIRSQLKAIREKMNVKTSLAIAAKVSKLSLPLGGSAQHVPANTHAQLQEA
ncbi:MAG: LuxR C-terminal-related transcriptional regulator [Hellea sp.]